MAEHELITAFRNGMSYEDAIDYCDRCITHANNLVDRFQRCADTYTNVRASIVRFMEEDMQRESN